MAKHIPLEEVPGGRSVAEILGEIRNLYFKTKAATIERDFDRAIDLLKSIPSPEDRQRATVYMEGLAEMRREWQKRKTRNRGRRPI
ncbi:MAG: hypothetical protein WBC51_09305 [Vicinamibacterales bacterium]|jgi:hypothetical protein